MLDNQNKPDPLPDEQLVAYLDGELDEGSVGRIESQLASDPELRRRLDSLSGVWTMLDELDQTQADKKLTESTLEIVALAAGSDAGAGNDTSARWQLRRILTFAGIMSSAFLLGFVCVAIARPDGNRRLLEDLAVVERLDELRQIDDIEFLRELHKSGLFSEDSPDD